MIGTGGHGRLLGLDAVGAARQRCIVHLMRNAAGNAPARQKRGAVPGMLMIMSIYFYPTASPLITQAGYRKLTNSG